MATVNAGNSQEVTVTAGKTLVVSTSGEAYVDYLTVLPDAGYHSDRLLATDRTYGPNDLDFMVRIRAISSGVDYSIGFPTISAGDIIFHRDDSDAIDGVIDPKTGDLVPLGGGDVSVAWGDITDKPTTFPPTIGTTSTTAKAGNYAPPNATGAARGLVLQGAAVADATEGTESDAINALLASLRTAGVIAT